MELLKQNSCQSKLQIRRGDTNNLEIFFLFLIENIYCDPSLEPSRRDGSNEDDNLCFL